MNIIVVTPPTAYPVTLAEVYEHLRLTPEGSPPTHPQDSMLERHIQSATGEAEQITHRALVQQALRLYGEGFSGYYSDYRRRYDACVGIELLRPPLIEVESVEYYDSANELAEVDAANYYVTDDLVPRLRFIDGFSYPTCYGRPDSFRVNYIAGYPPEGSPPDDFAVNVPSQIKEAILLGVTLLYEPLEPREREAIEKARDSLLSGFVVHSVA